MVSLGSFRVSCRVSYQDIFKALSFLWVAPRVFRVSLRIHTHKRIRLSFSDSLRFRLGFL